MQPTRRIATTAMRILCVAALVLAAFAHRPAVSVAANLPAYALPDGSQAVLCLSHGAPGQQNNVVRCEFCSIAGSAAVPAQPAVASDCEYDPSISIAGFPVLLPPAAHRQRNGPTRAPPRFLI
ncbi:hypothetical protein [Oricola cellulosilytica]|uniref:DUF2946 domain-containing protein n=1 Tax=Oricola cellulosilytica TaxID=1429082 RepID=A0A4R0PD50_9HYPH|nr:hypothetical protein [Oricola cellulosilytica]TCD14348.1 hypothetical protein E0D97_09755 [Oricola cellulosilytica]